MPITPPGPPVHTPPGGYGTATQFVVFEGDSITFGTSYVDQAIAGMELPQPSYINFASSGATIAILNTRTAEVDAAIVSGVQNVFCVLIGHNDIASLGISTYIANLKSYCLARRAAGYRIVLLTLLPSTAPGFNVLRNDGNRAIHQDNSFYDVLADVGADPTIGTDAAASNTAYYPDGTHPSDACYAVIAPYVTHAITALNEPEDSEENPMARDDANSGPKPYPVVYDANDGAIEYAFQDGYYTIPEAGANAITQLTGDVTAMGPGSVAATIAAGAVTNSKLANSAVTPAKIDQTAGENYTFPNGVQAVFFNATLKSVFQGLQFGGLYASANAGSSWSTLTGQDFAQYQCFFFITSSDVSETLPTSGTNLTGAMIFGVMNHISSTGNLTVNGCVLKPGFEQLFQFDGTNWRPYVDGTRNALTVTAGTGTVTPDVNVAATLSIPVSGSVTVNGPTNACDGQKAVIRVINDGSHSVTLATGSENFRFGTTVSGYTNSVSKTDYIGVIYNKAVPCWDVVALSQGF